MRESDASRRERSDCPAAAPNNIKLGQDSALDAGPREGFRGFGLVLWMTLGRHDEHRLCTNGRDKVLKAGHVIVVKRIDRWQVYDAATVCVAHRA